jgi:DNA-binding response OmpR family regulator
VGYRHVLVADDELEIREVVAEVLEEELGAEVEQVADGASAVLAIVAVRPELLLLDLRMPGLDGFGVLRELKGNCDTASVPVLAMTATGEDDIARALESGCAGFVAKPFDIDVLVATVRPFLRPAA